MKLNNIKQYTGKLLLMTVIICCFSVGVKAQAPAVPAAKATTTAPAAAVAKSALSIIETFFKKYKDDGTGPAIDYLFGTNKYFTNTAAINQLKAKLDSLRQSTGSYLGKELIVQKTASPSLYFYSFLVKSEIQPLRFTFVFYKPKNDWVLYRFKYDDSMETELEDAGKIDNKRP